MDTDDGLFDTGTWQRALDQYGAVTGLTTLVFDRDRRLVCGPRPPTPLFDLLGAHGFIPTTLADCIRDSLAPSAAHPDVTTAHSFGMAVVGASLRLHGHIVGAAVAGYALIDPCQASAMELLAQRAGLPFDQLWQIATQIQPITERRLTMHGQLLNILGETLLTARDRAHKVEEMMGQLEQRVQDRTEELATANRSLAAAVREHAGSEERVRKLLARLVVVREEERHRIALDIHDHMGQQLTALKLRLELLQVLAPGSAEWAEQLGYTQDFVSRLDANVESLTSDLRPRFVETLGMVRALANLIDEWQQTTGIAARFDNRAGDVAWLDGHAPLNLFRITQEALHNVSKHARATLVVIGLELLDDRLVLTVTDDGRGFDTADGVSRNAGIGLIGMQERAALMQATLTIESKADHGTVVRVAVPLGARAPRS